MNWGGKRKGAGRKLSTADKGKRTSVFLYGKTKELLRLAVGATFDEKIRNLLKNQKKI
jgi:hypothetical protein